MTITDLLRECEKSLELDAKATPGPWVRHDTSSLHGVAAGSPPANKAFLDRSDLATRVCSTNKSEKAVLNMAAIAHNRTHAPLASRAVIELARRIAVAEEALNWYAEFADTTAMNYNPTARARLAIRTLQAPLDSL